MTPEQAFFDAGTVPRDAKVLDLGCGEQKKVAWAIGLDRVKTAATDVVHDLDSYPWPFADDTFDVVIASHVLEHVADLMRLCEELHRVCRDGALVKVATPHFSSADAWADPTHRRAFGYRTFEFFARPQDARAPRLQQLASRAFGLEATVAGWYTEPRFEIVERRITFRRPHRLAGMAALAAQAPLLYEYFLSGLAPARDLLVTLRVRKRA